MRMEFANIFNRTEMENPGAANALAATTNASSGVLTGGFGFINRGSVFGRRGREQVSYGSRSRGLLAAATAVLS